MSKWRDLWAADYSTKILFGEKISYVIFLKNLWSILQSFRHVWGRFVHSCELSSWITRSIFLKNFSDMTDMHIQIFFSIIVSTDYWISWPVGHCLLFAGAQVYATRGQARHPSHHNQNCHPNHAPTASPPCFPDRQKHNLLLVTAQKWNAGTHREFSNMF